MHKVVRVKVLTNYLIEITFSDETSKIVDLRPYIGDGISKALKDEAFFQQVQIESGGGIYWPNGYDFCPEFLYDEVPAVSLESPG